MSTSSSCRRSPAPPAPETVTAAAWDVPGSTCTETDGRGLSLDAYPEPPVDGSDWLLPPGEADLATDPAVLRAALGEAARLIRAADDCR